MSRQIGQAGGKLDGRKVILDYKLDSVYHTSMLLDVWGRMETEEMAHPEHKRNNDMDWKFGV